MSEAPGRLRSVALVSLLVCASALALSACGSTAVADQRATGSPSINISVPLSNVACTTSDSCVAVGTSQSDGAPSTAGQVRLATGRWIAIGVPAVASAFVTDGSCGSSQCLFVGQDQLGDLVWRYDATGRTVVSLSAPSDGTGASAVSCAANLTCMIADATLGGPRLLSTIDGGSSWTTQSTPTTGSGDRIVHLACTSASECLAVTQLTSGGIDISMTSDGGASWTSTASSITSNAVSVSSLSCVARTCVIVYSTASGTSVARSTDDGVKWTDLDVGASADLVACASAKRCVISGRSGSTPWIATTVGRHVTKVTLRYVPFAIESLSCGSKVCAGVSATTVVSVRATP